MNFKELANDPGSAAARASVTARILVAGGDSAGSAATTTTEILDPATGLFSPANAMPELAWCQLATLLNNGDVRVTGELQH